MEPKPETTKKKDSLLYINNFITRLNLKILKCSKNSIPIATNAITAICDKNITLLKEYSSKGLPDDLPILRAFVWKLLLNYLPDEPKKWEETLNQKRELYTSYKNIVEEKLEIELKEKNYKSKDLLEQIIKDVYRTNPKISFFYEPVNKNLKNKESQDKFFEYLEKRKKSTFNDIDEIYYNDKENEIHVDVLKRILFVYSTIHPDISYHQGMNELLAPIFYCFSYDKSYKEESEENIEADSFWCFDNLMSKVSLAFVSARNRGLDAKSYIFEKCLQFVDKEISSKLNELNIRCEYYCYRWIILLFGQEFEINDVIKLWDIIFSKDDVYYYVIYFAIAVMIMKKDIIIKGEMVDIMQTLQNFEDINVDELIQLTKKLNEKYKKNLDEFILKTKSIKNKKKDGNKKK